MTEIFKRLVAQCTYQVYNSNQQLYDKFDREKFAELIVRECADKAYAGIGPDSLDEYDRGWQAGRNNAAKVIKEHFDINGVKND